MPLRPIFLSLPRGWEIVWWNNGDRTVTVTNSDEETVVDVQHGPVPNLGPHGRFAAIEYASHDLIYVQDDDVIVSDLQAIVGRWEEGGNWPCRGCNGQRSALCADCEAAARERTDHLVANMPQEFRPHYPDSCMVGFGAAFHRDAPEKAFQRFLAYHSEMQRDDPLFLRESCRIFSVLTARVLVDIAKTDMPYASDTGRLWKQPDHLHFRERALKMAREVRDNG